MIDGARMVTPGVLSWALRLLELTPNSVVEVRGWRLGPKFQPDSVAEGYDHKVETQLLDETRWWEMVTGFSILQPPARRRREVCHNRPRSRTVSSSAAICLRKSAALTSAMKRPVAGWLISIFMRERWRRRTMAGRFGRRDIPSDSWRCRDQSFARRIARCQRSLACGIVPPPRSAGGD